MKVNLVTLCSGIEAQGQALRNLCNEHPELEWELVVWREIDKDAIAAHNAIFPEYAARNIATWGCVSTHERWDILSCSLHDDLSTSKANAL